jgi:tetratricopeptide (TPR) repeat protein
MALQLMGLVDRHEGRADQGLARLREALALEESLPYEFGPPLVVVPSGELLGTVLLDEGLHDEATAAFRATLAVAPGRARSLLGLARAAERAGSPEAARRAWDRLLENWHAADDGIAGLAEARRGRDRDPGTGGSPWS